MSDGSDLARLADFVQDPLLVLTVAGQVEMANRAAIETFGKEIAGADLAATAVDSDGFRRYLVRCSGSRSPMIGSAVLTTGPGGERRFQMSCALLRPADGAEGARLVLKCRARGPEEFSILGRKIDELNREIRQRRSAQAALEESISQKDTLLRELQHRTKNYTQMLLGMLSTAASSCQSDEAKAVLDTATRRLRAIGAAQQLMYEVERLESVSARDLVHGVCGAVAGSWPPSIELGVDSEDAELPNDVAVPLALILNELLSNALKHGLKHGEGRVAVDLHRTGSELLLSVWDSGRNAPTGIVEKRTSGLSIVRGLCRQIGGVFAIHPSDGVRATVRFPDPAEASTRSVGLEV